MRSPRLRFSVRQMMVAVVILAEITALFVGWSRSVGWLPTPIDLAPSPRWANTGYSRDGRTALFCIGIAPSGHGAAGCYLLRRVKGRWEIVQKSIYLLFYNM